MNRDAPLAPLRGAAVRSLAWAARQIEEAVFPGRCLLCGRWLSGLIADRAPLCQTCRPGLEWIREPRCGRCGIALVSEKGTCMRCRTADFAFDSNLSLFSYTGSARRLVACLKFEGRTRLVPWFAGLACAAVRRNCGMGVVVPVPSRPGRRGADAVESVTRELERRHGLSVCRCLARAGGPQQKSLDYLRRQANLRGKILVRTGRRAARVPERVILLDDVFTTGATLDACARVLRASGCTEVRAVTLVMEE